MSYINIEKHNGKDIVHINLADCPTTEVPATLQAAHENIKKFPPKSALIYTDVTNAAYTKEIANAMKDFTHNNTPYVKASAVKGAEGIRMVLLQTVALMTRREMKTFDDEKTAKDWLAAS
jgi:CRISPR/Cas system CSM-associated protein Csm5 (group 7 of RAMP superfamily)